jgi:hypothetical protein
MALLPARSWSLRRQLAEARNHAVSRQGSVIGKNHCVAYSAATQTQCRCGWRGGAWKCRIFFVGPTFKMSGSRADEEQQQAAASSSKQQQAACRKQQQQPHAAAAAAAAAAARSSSSSSSRTQQQQQPHAAAASRPAARSGGTCKSPLQPTEAQSFHQNGVNR